VERTFPVHSPSIAKIEVVTRGKVRRAKLYYLRELRGKKARIKERREGYAELVIEETADVEEIAEDEATLGSESVEPVTEAAEQQPNEIADDAEAEAATAEDETPAED
jgi:hypothetical protein